MLDPLSLYAESEEAHRIKRDKPVLVVLGNPPYSGYAGIAQMDEERALSERYRPTKTKGQGLNDLYVRFFAIDRRIQRTGRGLVCLISNYSWLEGLSFALMRERLLQAYDRIEIENLHGDKYATGKTTPEGAPDPSVFSTEFNREGIQVGTAVATLMRTGVATESEVRYRDFWGVTKRESFLRQAGEWIQITPIPALGLPFRPCLVEADYLTWPRLTELLPTTFSGMKTVRDSFVVDIDRSSLDKRILAYYNPKVNSAKMREIAPVALIDTRGFDALKVRAFLQGKGLKDEGFVRYAYRPFDVRWLYWEGTTKLIDEKRTDYMPHVRPDNPVLVCAEAQRREFSPPLLTQAVASSHLIERASLLFPLPLEAKPSGEQITLLDDLSGGSSDGGLLYNLSEMGRGALEAQELADAPESLFFHALAILHAPAYAAEHADALRQDWPRVPVTGPPGWMAQGAALGRRVAALLDSETPVAGIEAGDIDPALHSVARFEWSGEGSPREGTDDLALRAGWRYRGQGGVTMPGNGRTVAHEDGTRDVILNEQARWAGVPDAVWEYKLGGYQVLKKWLSYRDREVLGRPMTLAEVRHFTATARRIAALLAMGPELDAHYRGSKAS